MSDPEDLKVEHNEIQQEFIIQKKEGRASLHYALVNENTMDLQHTQVADKLRGKGYGDLLAKAALTYALKNKLNVKLTCSFLNHYFVKNSLSRETYKIV